MSFTNVMLVLRHWCQKNNITPEALTMTIQVNDAHTAEKISNGIKHDINQMMLHPIPINEITKLVGIGLEIRSTRRHL